MLPIVPKTTLGNPEVLPKNHFHILELPCELLVYIFEFIGETGQRSPNQVSEFPHIERNYIRSKLNKFSAVACTCRLFNEIIQNKTKIRFINNHHLSLEALGFETANGAVEFAIINQLKSVNLVGYREKINDALIQNLAKKNLNLRHLFIQNASITNTGLSDFSNLENLTSLNLKYCLKITDTGLSHLSNLKKLTWLNLWGCNQITDKGLSHLRNLKNLTSLDLGWCHQITDTGLSHLSKLENLTWLNLGWFYKITDMGLSDLSELKNLTGLNLWGCNQITDTKIAQLKKSLPKLQVFQ